MGKGLIEKWVSGQGAPHLFVVGGSGAGKTTLVRKIALFLLQHGTLNVIDFDKEYVDLPLETVTPPFPVFVPSMSFLGWLVSQASRPEEGGFATASTLDFFEDAKDLDEVISKIKYDPMLPSSVRYAALWRISLFRKYFIIKAEADDDLAGRVFDLSGILSIRERQAVQQILLSYLINSNARWVVVEEVHPGPWISDISMLARRRGKRLILVSQIFPEDPQNYELVIFTPYPISRQIPLPVNPLYDKGVWWVGRLGVHRIKW